MHSFKNHHLAFFLGIAILFACGPKAPSPEEQAVEALEKEVMAIHDEVMPKMSQLESLTTSLQTELNKPELDSMLRMEIQNSITLLEAGDSLMWNWMHNYKKPEGVPLYSLSTYFQSEKAKVTTMRNAMLEGLQRAESLVKKLDNAKPN